MFDKLGDIGKLFEQMQEKAKKLQEEQEQQILTAKSGGGMVQVSANGKGEIIDIQIDNSLLEDKESLQILLMSALNDLFKMVEENRQKNAMNLFDPSMFGKE